MSFFTRRRNFLLLCASAAMLSLVSIVIDLCTGKYLLAAFMTICLFLNLNNFRKAWKNEDGAWS
jgi:hypothetical protein